MKRKKVFTSRKKKLTNCSMLDSFFLFFLCHGIELSWPWRKAFGLLHNCVFSSFSVHEHEMEKDIIAKAGEGKKKKLSFPWIYCFFVVLITLHNVNHREFKRKKVCLFLPWIFSQVCARQTAITRLFCAYVVLKGESIFERKSFDKFPEIVVWSGVMSEGLFFSFYGTFIIYGRCT